MKLSPDRIRHLSKQIMAELDNVEMLDYGNDPNEVRLKIISVFNHELEIDEDVHKAVIEKMNSKEGAFLMEGTPEWDAEYEQMYQHEMVKRRGFSE